MTKSSAPYWGLINSQKHNGKEHMELRGIYNEATTMLILRIHIVMADLILVGNVVIYLL